MATSLISIPASLAGGQGACYAPCGEREGQSPLASKHRCVNIEEHEGRSPLAVTDTHCIPKPYNFTH